MGTWEPSSIGWFDDCLHGLTQWFGHWSSGCLTLSVILYKHCEQGPNVDTGRQHHHWDYTNYYHYCHWKGSPRAHWGSIHGQVNELCACACTNQSDVVETRELGGSTPLDWPIFNTPDLRLPPPTNVCWSSAKNRQTSNRPTLTERASHTRRRSVELSVWIVSNLKIWSPWLPCRARDHNWKTNESPISHTHTIIG